jgi:tetratricopeptide (TPR) repeat protein/predicted Ser/Thr protein kinase
MPDNVTGPVAELSRVRELLEQVLDSGSSLEDACRDSPELLPHLRKRWERLRAIQAQVGALFPAPESTPGPGITPPVRPVVELPQIPGYDVQGILGRGGMGVVFKAWHVRLHRPVALKMLLVGACATSAEKERFVREAEAVANLTHPNIVQVHDVGDHDGRAYFTMEFVNGGSLAEQLKGVPQPSRQAAVLVAKLAEAVHVAHQNGIIHRDLKPANILLTTDGMPKISDFGLARRLEDASGLTMSGAAMGTPSYMAPEQAQGKSHAVGPAADVYALGVVLYELLTGRPPFRAETAAETVQQVISREPLPPTRLGAKVPRDLETICLKCLRKEPERRYASAVALADDLRRFLDDRPIHARPSGWPERMWRWARRDPAAAALVATALALGALAIGGGFWVQRQQAAARAATAQQEQAVEAALAHAEELTKLGHWPEARRALEGAPRLLETSARADLRERLRRARADADVVVRLEDVRLRLSEGNPVRGRTSPVADHLYSEAFARYGIMLNDSAAADAAAVVRSSQVREILLVFLHDWLYWALADNRDRLRALIDLADDNRWRRAFRDARSRDDVRVLEELARAPEAMSQPAALLSGLGGALLADGQATEARTLLRAAQQRYPGDFWINYLLGLSLEQEHPQEAAGYFRAAVALRPGSDQANARLSGVLHYLGDSDAAIAALQQAVALNPSRTGIAALVKVLAPKGRLEEARLIWEKMLERDPPDHDLWYGYAQLCLLLGKDDKFRRAREAMLRRFGESDDWIVAERTSLASLLLADSPDGLRSAAELADRAVAAAAKSSEPDNGYVQFVKGLSEYRLDRLDQAVPLLREAAQKIPSRPGPRLVLAMAQFRSGSPSAARNTLAAAVATYDWKQLPEDTASVWTSHILRREAEAMILPNLPAFLQGKHRPHDNDERLALLAICQAQGLYAACAQLYVDAFAADPGFAEASAAECLGRAAMERDRIHRIRVLKTEPRYLAARCAALAGCGLGEDGPKLNDVERTRWRRQAREWLQADLAAWARTLESESQAFRDLAKEMLMLWLVEPDVSRLREPGALMNLSTEEREEWALLWRDVRLALEK